VGAFGGLLNSLNRDKTKIRFESIEVRLLRCASMGMYMVQTMSAETGDVWVQL
jgi:alpha-D-ribose 1-methylphosphonate 5-triphosphate synthase subunit PhnG